MPTDSLLARFTAAWSCVVCRRYRRAALAFGALSFIAWLLL